MDAHRRALSPHTHSRLWLPRPSLTACVRAVLTRSTLGAELTPEQRHNHFPAAPLASLTWWRQGAAQPLPLGQLHSPLAQIQTQPVLPRWMLAGPFSQPMTSCSTGPMAGVIVLLPPDAWHRLTGLPVQDWVNRWADARTVLPADWQALDAAICAAADDAVCVQAIEQFLEPRWAQVRPHGPMRAERYADWAQSLALHAATSAPGRSLRQVERRIKRWAGLPLRELRGLGRSEQAFFNTLLATRDGGPPNWAELADASGYADQSHLCRETRRVTGCSPDELYRRIQGEESFWAYRLWQ